MKTKSCLAPVVGQPLYDRDSPFTKRIVWVWPPHRIPVTTKIIITFFIGNPYKPSFTTVTVRGPHPTYRFFGCLESPEAFEALGEPKVIELG